MEFDRVTLDDDVAGLPDDLHAFEDFALSLEGDGGQRERLLLETDGGGVGLVPDEGDTQGVASCSNSLEVEGAVLGGDGTRLELAVTLEEAHAGTEECFTLLVEDTARDRV